jgi:hypothetical protein
VIASVEGLWAVGGSTSVIVISGGHGAAAVGGAIRGVDAVLVRDE